MARATITRERYAFSRAAIKALAAVAKGSGGRPDRRRPAGGSRRRGRSVRHRKKRSSLNIVSSGRSFHQDALTWLAARKGRES